MIVQADSPDTGHFSMTMAEHTAFAAALAQHFGNSDFERLRPRELMLHLTANHDTGWQDFDRQLLRNPDTGLPYHLVQTPFVEILKTSSASPRINAQHHAYCGLLSSMHSWGLYNGRYGMSDKVLLDDLAGEERRQARLRESLRADPETAPLLHNGGLWQNYKQLQFFDTLALYFNCAPEGARSEATFTHVPMNNSEDADLKVTPLGDGHYSVDPYPFDADPLPLSYSGRYLSPVTGR